MATNAAECDPAVNPPMRFVSSAEGNIADMVNVADAGAAYGLISSVVSDGTFIIFCFCNR